MTALHYFTEDKVTKQKKIKEKTLPIHKAKLLKKNVTLNNASLLLIC